MNDSDFLKLRLRNQLISPARARRPQDVVRSLVAMQAQEYAMAKWAIALRLAVATTDARIERAFNAGRILRTHLLRPTWHFVAPEDIRWLLMLTAPRVHAANAYQYRQLHLNAAVFRRSDVALVEALRGGRHLTRTDLQEALARKGIKASGPRLGYLMMHAELEALICSGPRAGRQFTYALLDERVPAAPMRSRAAALAELTRRYFASRGPATAQDFSTWSGFTLEQARAGIETLDGSFTRRQVAGRTYLFKETTPDSGSSAVLLPDYDEYGMSYRDRTAMLPGPRPAFAFNRMIVLDGRFVGSWRRTLVRGRVSFEMDFNVRLSAAQKRAVAKAASRYRDFAADPAEPTED